MKNIQVRQMIDFETCTFTYLLWCQKTKKCLIIDPVLEQFKRDIEIINQLGLKLEYVLETHVHADHITSASKFKDETNCSIVYGSQTGVEGPDIFLNDDESLDLGEHQIKAIHTPGHTSGCTCYYIKDYIFTGDTLFIGGTGRTDFQGGCASNTFDNIRKKIFIYPDNTIVYPCHNYNGLTCSTIGNEKKNNPNVGLHISKEDFLDNESKKERPYPKKFDIAVPANMKCGKID